MVFVNVSVRTVKFHGPMVKLFGREFKYRAITVPKAIDAMRNLLPGFERYMLEAHNRGLTFSIFVGKRNVSQDELELTQGTDDIHIVSVVIGSKRAGLFQTILGVALVATAAYFTGGAAIGMGAGFFQCWCMGAASLVGIQPAGALRWLLEGANGEGVAPQSADVMLSFHFSA